MIDRKKLPGSLQQVRCRAARDSVVVETPLNMTIRLKKDGKWLTFIDKGTFYRRTIDGGIAVSSGDALFSLDQSLFPDFHAVVNRRAGELITLLQSGQYPVVFANNEMGLKEVLDVLTLARSWDQGKVLKDRERYQNAYLEDVPILPPDRYNDLVLQPATGCPFGKCTFCAFYKDKMFKVYDSLVFREHMRLVNELMGFSLGDKDGIFLGSASALSIPQKRMLAVLAEVNADFYPLKRGIACFYDPDHAPHRSQNDFNQLAKMGLTHVTIGLESGLPELRGALGKNKHLESLSQAIQQLKQAGISCGITILVGAGGQKLLNRHLTVTTSYVAGLPLDRNDIVYLSPLAGSLEDLAMAESQGKFKSLLRQQTAARITHYSMHKFFYYN